MEKIKELRNQLGMSQAEFAEYFGFNLRTLQNWESGRVKPADYVYDMIERRINEGVVYTDLKETKDKTKTYEYRDGFLVDIVDSGDEISAYLYHKNYGVKDLMFELMKKDVESEEELKEMITNNLTNQSFIENYTEEYMEGNEYNGETMMDVYRRTLRNCQFYEKENNIKKLINEIGVLRGIFYCLQSVGVSCEDDEFKYFIDKQVELTSENDGVNEIDTDELKTYVVASNLDPTCIVVAHSEDEAISMVQKQAEKDLPTDIRNNIMDWEAYEVNSYFSTDYEPKFFGWVKGELHEYLTFA